MQKLILSVVAVLALVATGCGCKKSEGCKPGDTSRKCDRCYTEYCKYIGTRLADPRVRAGEEVKYEDGTIIRSVPKDKITKWETFQEMNAPKTAAAPAAATPTAAPAPAAAAPAAK